LFGNDQRKLSGDILAAVFLRSVLSLSLLIAAGCSTLAGGESGLLQPKGYVNDFANIIDVNTRDRLTALCTELDRKTHAQIAVVTIDSLGGNSLEAYATSLFNRWGIGHKEDNRGILIVLSLSDRKYRIEIGRGFEPLFPNDRVARIGGEMIPDLKKQKYSEAVLHSTSVIASIIAKERGVKLTTLPEEHAVGHP
jgi:uncharacterized protein